MLEAEFRPKKMSKEHELRKREKEITELKKELESFTMQDVCMLCVL